MGRVDLAEPETSSSGSGAVPPTRTAIGLDAADGDGGGERGVPRPQSTGRNAVWPVIGLLVAWLVDLLIHRF